MKRQLMVLFALFTIMFCVSCSNNDHENAVEQLQTFKEAVQNFESGEYEEARDKFAECEQYKEDEVNTYLSACDILLKMKNGDRIELTEAYAFYSKIREDDNYRVIRDRLEENKTFVLFYEKYAGNTYVGDVDKVIISEDGGELEFYGDVEDTVPLGTFSLHLDWDEISGSSDNVTTQYIYNVELSGDGNYLTYTLRDRERMLHKQ